ncbi:MAG: DUF512 domain-containing protein [Defluviitaleaceae bacterium]|nr:DUF512 domain-containing protein [Defluviitaleaceae bacterium]
MNTCYMNHRISDVIKGSIACELELAPEDTLLTINGEKIKDALHYRYLTQGEEIVLEIEKPDGEVWELEIEKDPDEELGLVFALPNMSPTRKCKNNCIFCFVAQQPKGLRESLYLKDDDPWLSYVMGNYITLTNLDDGDIERMAHFHLSPLRISVHAADMDLRCEMMGNKKAGNLFKILDIFSAAGITMHFQAVICRGINDGEKLRETIEKLSQQQGAQSLAIVPAGLTSHREGLPPLTQFSAKEAEQVIKIVEEYQQLFRKDKGTAFVFAADEWYIMTCTPFPKYDLYEDFPQLDNGVGMIRLFEQAFMDAAKLSTPLKLPKKNIGIITGTAASKFMQSLATQFEIQHPNIKIKIYTIKNNFFGELITVSGLLTGQDILAQLGKDISSDVLFIPENAFRAETTTMLDGTTLAQLSETLGIPIKIGKTDGSLFYNQLIKEE